MGAPQADPRLISGRAVAGSIEERTTALCQSLRANGVDPLLAVLYRGDHADAASYRRVILQRAARAGLTVRPVPLPDDADADMMLASLDELNGDSTVHGVLAQNPLPAELRHLVGQRLAAHKDVEGLTAGNLGRLMLDEAEVLPCTPAAIIALIESRMPSLLGKRVVIVNRSATVGRPLSQILLNKRATVTICSTATVDLPGETRRADVLIVAIGRPRAIGPEYIGEGALVIDVGINETPDGSGICGDVDTAAVLDRVLAITPVPGGVGPVTTAMLIANCAELARLHGRAGA